MSIISVFASLLRKSTAGKMANFMKRPGHFSKKSGSDSKSIHSLCLSLNNSYYVMNIGNFERLESLRYGLWKDCRGEVLRLGWVELHNYDSERKGLFSEELNKISGLTSHCSLKGFARIIKQMSAALTSQHNSDILSTNIQYSRNFMAVWERFRAKVEECWPDATGGGQFNDQVTVALAQSAQTNAHDAALRCRAPSQYAVSTALAKHAIIPGRSLSVNHSSSATSSSSSAPAAAPAPAAVSSFTARSIAPSTTDNVQEPLRRPENAQISFTRTVAPSTASAVESSRSVAELKAAAEKYLSKLSKTSAGFVSERLLLQFAWKFMSECDKLKTFAQPVSAKDAPDYSDKIKRKMALSNMQTRVKHGYYGTLEAFGNDIQLIVDNCNLYNAGNLYYTKQAEEFLAAWKIYYEKAIVLRKDQPVVPPSPAAPISTTVSSDPGSERTNHVTERARGNLTDLPVHSTAQVQAHPANNREATVLGKHPRDNPVNNNNNNILQAGWPATPRTLQTLPDPFVLSRLEMKSLVRVVTDSEYVRPFWGTNDRSMGQGRAMDFATLRSNIDFGAYDHSAVPFVADIRLIWENGVKCNSSDSDIALCAAKLGEQFETQLGLVLDQMKKERQEKQQQEEEKNQKRTPVVASRVSTNEQHSVARSGNIKMSIHPPTIGAKHSEAPATVVTEKANKASRVLPTSYANFRADTLPVPVLPATSPTTAPAVSTTFKNNTKNNTNTRTRTTAPKAVDTSTAGVPVPIPVVLMTVAARSSAPPATARSSATVPATLTTRVTAPTEAPPPTPADVPVTTDTNRTDVPAAVPAAVPLDTLVEILKFLTQHGDETYKKNAMRQLLVLATQR